MRIDSRIIWPSYQSTAGKLIRLARQRSVQPQKTDREDLQHLLQAKICHTRATWRSTSLRRRLPRHVAGWTIIRTLQATVNRRDSVRFSLMNRGAHLFLKTRKGSWTVSSGETLEPLVQTHFSACNRFEDQSGGTSHAWLSNRYQG